ncbi:hypothetical protein GGR23_000559 [Gellertiella hungarica]|uniref:Uncharacterized protein n=1 Tax=Gellertiella hungarica TaxID=1572859 RepID=A0A7W6NJ56_9HYPH|nr:hypothetical protein [Gellertiella hungarica]
MERNNQRDRNSPHALYIEPEAVFTHSAFPP